MDVLGPYRQLCQSPADAIRWACILEATAPKVGNVFPGRSFVDLQYCDFVRASEISSATFASTTDPFSQCVLTATKAVREELGTNVNLGILLLIGPLFQVDRHGGLDGDLEKLSGQVSHVLKHLNAEDSRRLYEAINIAAPGGMGQVDEMDLSDSPPETFLEAMRSASCRDRIAENYAGGYRDLLLNVVPTVADSIEMHRDTLVGISRAHLCLLRNRPDTLIERKYGRTVADEVRRRAEFDHDDPNAVRRFDDYLRHGRSTPINPGTTADLIATALYVLLRFPQSMSTDE